MVAVADEQSNSLIVSAPDETIPGIEDIIKKIDTSITAVTDSRIFRLRYADAVELAAIITSLYSDTSTQNNGRNGNTNNNGRRGGQQGGGFGGFPGFGGAQPAQGSQQTQRELLQSKVVAVGDPRTNSLIVTAAHEQMSQIAEMVGRLDATDAKKQHVYTHSLQHADAGTVADVLRGMLGQQTNSNSSQAGTNVLTQRSANGATLDTAGTTNQGRTGQ